MRWTTNGAKLLSENTGHGIEEVMALVSDVGQVVKCGSVVIADLSGVEPGGYGSSSGDGEEDAVKEQEEERLRFCTYFFGELLGECVKEGNGLLLSLTVHRSWLFG